MEVDIADIDNPKSIFLGTILQHKLKSPAGKVTKYIEIVFLNEIDLYRKSFIFGEGKKRG